MTERPKAKIAMRDGRGEVETVWADDLGEGRYKLDNLPWFTYGISAADEFEAAADGTGQLWFVRMLRKSGNRTLRVILQMAPTASELTFESQGVLPVLESLGCRWEGATQILFAVNIPPDVDLATVTEALDETDVRWEYADPTPEEMGILGPTDAAG
jgi:hypothetical protein